MKIVQASSGGLCNVLWEVEKEEEALGRKIKSSHVEKKGHCTSLNLVETNERSLGCWLCGGAGGALGGDGKESSDR